MNKRTKNEIEYQTWEVTESGGRLYQKSILAADKSGKTARYEKLVDKEDKTIFFTQKIFDKQGDLIEIHEKYPVDKGHIILSIGALIVVGFLLLNFI